MLTADNALVQPVLNDGQLETSRLHTPAQSDALLQASRRVDWRFLLPDPNLGEVAYLGPAHGSLLESLRLFSAALTVIEVTTLHDRQPAQFDVVVMNAPSDERVKQGAALVRPEGFLYVEVRRRWGRSPADYVSAIRRLGFAEVEAYWHWPNFEACAEIVPLGDPVAVLHALGRRRSGVAARLKSAVGRWLLQSGLLVRVIPCFSMVAHKER
jgi:hypothetical protein